MTIQAVIDMIDTLKPNMFPAVQKVAWLNDLDGMIYREIILNHHGAERYADFRGYDQDTSTNKQLLAPEPYSDVYKHYLAAQMDIANRETDEYNRSMVLYNKAWQNLADYWNREHMPIQRAKELRF